MGSKQYVWGVCRTQLKVYGWSVFTKIVDSLLFLVKRSIIDVQLGSKYASVVCKE